MAEQQIEEQPLKRRRRAETRQLMLIAGALRAGAYALGQAQYRPEAALSHIRFDEVLELATKLQLYLEAHEKHLSDDGFDPLEFAREHMAQVEIVEIETVKTISRGSAYFAFDDEGDYRSKLAEYLLGAQPWSDVDVWQKAFADLQEHYGGELPPFEEALRAMAGAAFEHWGKRPEPFLEMALAQFASDPTLADMFDGAATRRRQGIANGPGLNDWFAELLDRYGRVMKPGIPMDRLTTMVIYLTYGFLFGSRSASRAVTEPVSWDGADDSLHSIAVEALFSHLTTLSDRSQ